MQKNNTAVTSAGSRNKAKVVCVKRSTILAVNTAALRQEICYSSRKRKININTIPNPNRLTLITYNNKNFTSPMPGFEPTAKWLASISAHSATSTVGVI